MNRINNMYNSISNYMADHGKSMNKKVLTGIALLLATALAPVLLGGCDMGDAPKNIDYSHIEGRMEDNIREGKHPYSGLDIGGENGCISFGSHPDRRY